MSDPEVKDLADEIATNPRAFAIRFVGLLSDVGDVKASIRRGTWLMLATLAGIVTDLLLRLAPDAGGTAQAAATAVWRAVA